jgi:SNF2 family DNA or RNA helicase
MITTGTVEERKRDMLGYKRRLARAIEDGQGADKDGSIKNDVASLTSWLEGR